jgi:hypothetical protein
MSLGNTQIAKIKQQHPISSSEIYGMLLGTDHLKILLKNGDRVKLEHAIQLQY